MEISLDYRFFRWQGKGGNSKEDSESISDGVFLPPRPFLHRQSLFIGRKKAERKGSSAFSFVSESFRELSDKLCNYRRLLPLQEQSGRTLDPFCEKRILLSGHTILA